MILIGVIAALFLLVKGFLAFNRFLTGWSTLTQRFPGADAHGPGQKFECRGDIAALRNASYTIQMANEGLLIRPFFARKDPILIPWANIKTVSETDAGVLGNRVSITVDYEKCIWFYIRNDAEELLQAIRGNIPPDRIEGRKSLADAINLRRT